MAALPPRRRPVRTTPGPAAPPRIPTQPSPGAANAESPEAPRRPIRRKPARPVRRNESDSGSLIMVRIGLIVAVVVIGGVIKLATAKPAGDQTYWNALVRFDQNLDKQVFLSPGDMRRQLNHLPIGGVTDSRLREFHQTLLALLELSEKSLSDPSAEQRAQPLIDKLERLRLELNRDYGRG